MSLLNFIKNVFSIHPKSPNEFVKKFIKDSKRSRVQLEMIHNGKIILQIDSLKFVPSWFKITKVDSSFYRNGYVIFFILERENLEGNTSYQNYLKSELEMVEIEEMHGETEIITFANFLDESVNFLNMSQCMRKIIDEVYTFKEVNPQILFNLRYLD